MIRKILFLFPMVAAIFATSCKKDETPQIFSISPQNITFNYEGDSSYVSVYGEKEKWEMWIGDKNTSDTWCSFDKACTEFMKGGKGRTEAIKIYSKPNPNRFKLSDTLYLKDLTGDYGIIKVKLTLAPESIKFSTDTLNYIAQAGGEFKLKLNTNVDGIEILSEAEGITSSFNLEGKELIFDIEPNDLVTTTKRVITVKGFWNETETGSAKSISLNIAFIQDGTTSLKSDSTNLAALNTKLSLGWDLSKPVATWNGVQVGLIANSDGMVQRVIALNLSSIKNSGVQLPNEISQLAYLQNLRLDNCYFIGRIPIEYFSLNYLETLYLGNNSLTGELNVKIGDLENLRILSIINTQMDGPIPMEISKLKKLYTLELSNNMFSGSLPSEIGVSKILTTFTVNGNLLTGNVPLTYKSNINWYNWNPSVYILPQKNGVILN